MLRYLCILFFFTAIAANGQSTENSRNRAEAKKVKPKKQELFVKLSDSFSGNHDVANMGIGKFISAEKQSELGIEGIMTLFNPSLINAAKAAVFVKKNNLPEKLLRIKISPSANLEQVARFLEEQYWVEYAEPSFEYDLLYTPEEPYLDQHWGHFTTQVFDAWDISKGDTNIVIGIVDTGSKLNHPSLVNQFYYNEAERYGQPGIDDDANGFVDDSLGYDFADMDANAWDQHGHGTQVASTASAKVDDNFGVMGTGFHCKIMPLKIYSASTGLLVNVWEAVIYGALNGCKIINLSLGRSGGASRTEQELVKYVTEDLNVLIVAAAGNETNYADYFPASYDNVLSVGLSNTDDTWAGSYSHFIDILAPGVGLPVAHLSRDPSKPHYTTGSSFSSPFTAGVAGLIWSQFPELNAQQVEALIRVTADDVYDSARNTSKAEMLGKGRLNAFRALTEKAEHPAIKLKRLFAEHRKEPLFPFGDFIKAVVGDTVEVWGSFYNYLKPTSSSLTIKLSSTSPYVQMVDSIYQPGIINTLDSALNDQSPFKLMFKENLPFYAKILFRLEFQDGDYSDYQYFYVYSDSVIDFKANKIATSTSSNGRLGNVGSATYPRGSGFLWEGQQLLKEAGLMIGSNAGSISDATINENGYACNDFYPIAYSEIKKTDDVLMDVSGGQFLDYPGNPDSVGVLISEHYRGWNEPEYKDFLLVDYIIKNDNPEPIDSLYTGIYADWDLSASEETSSWDSVYQFGYIQTEGVTVGVKALESGHGFSSFDRSGTITGEIDLSDGFTNEEKLKSIAEINNEEMTSPDVAQVVSAITKNIAPNASDTITFAIAMGHNLRHVRQSMMKAAKKANFTGDDSLYSPIPIVSDTLFCEGTPLLIYPDSGEVFHFYADKNLNSLIYTGRYLEISVEDTSKTFFVTNQDKAYESMPTAVSIRQVHAKAGIIAPDTLDIDQQTVAQIKVFPKSKGLDWKLLVANGDSTLGESLSDTTLLAQVFHSVGIYELTLTTQNELGCTDTLRHTLTAIRSSYQANMEEDSTKTCIGNGYEIVPNGGSLFNFYDADKDSLIDSGASLWVENVNLPKRYRITAADSAIESLPTYFYLDTTSLPLPTIQLSTDTLNLAIGEYMLAVYSAGEGTASWDFGNGITAEGQQANAAYSETGIYRITLKVTNELGCTDSTYRDITVIDDAALGMADAWIAGWKLYPNPTKGMLSLQWAEGYKGELQVTAINVTGREVADFSFQSGNQVSQLDFTALPKGLYVLKLKLGSHLWHHKVMIEK